MRRPERVPLRPIVEGPCATAGRAGALPWRVATVLSNNQSDGRPWTRRARADGVAVDAGGAGRADEATTTIAAAVEQRSPRPSRHGVHVSFKVESDNLRSQAEEWGKRATHADTVRSDISASVGAGYDFGLVARWGRRRRCTRMEPAVENALKDCAYSATYLQAALTSTANDYDETDATQAQDAAKLDRLLEDSGYTA